MTDLNEAGREVMSALLGDDGAERARQNLEAFDPAFSALVTEQVFGAVWGRPRLELRERSMITMAALIALNRRPQLEGQIRIALRLGVTEAQIKEMILHLTPYAGLPCAVEAAAAYRAVTEAPKPG